MSANAAPNLKIDSLQAMRALCAIPILFGHGFTAFLYSQPMEPSILTTIVMFCIMSGEAWLDLFFVGSGFVMTYIAQGLFGQKGAGKRFMFARLTRIVPAFWLWLTFAIILACTWETPMLQQGVTMEGIAKSYLFIPYGEAVTREYALNLPWPVLIPAWTLNFEIIFYALFALVLMFSQQRALIILSGIGAALIAVHQFVPAGATPLFFWTSPMILKFLAGCWIGYAFNRGVYFDIKPRWGYVIIGAGMVLNMALYLFFKLPFMYSVWFNIAASLFGVMVVGGIVLTPIVRRRFSPGMIAVGDASYSIYLCQNVLLVALLLVPDMYLDLGYWTALALTFVVMGLCVVCGLLSYRYFEKPASAYLRRLVIKDGQNPR